MTRNALLLLLWLLGLDIAAQQRFTVSGHIVETVSSETMIGATVRDALSGSGTQSNAYGFYTLTLPEGAVELSFSYAGYQAEHRKLQLTADTVINIQLKPNDMLREVLVTTDRPDAGIRATGMGVTDVSVEQIAHTPALMGETDVVRTLQLLPGVQSGMNGMAGLYVRGGGGDENLIMLDGTPIYKVDHLFGFFSVFTPEAMKKVTFYKGSFPARYTGRLSSVVDVRTRDGDMQHFHGTASIGLLTSRLNLEGPIVKDRTSFCLSARTTYWDWVARPFMPSDTKFSYKFFDLNAKLNHRFSDADRIYLSLYAGQDRMKDDYVDTWGTHDESSEKYGNNLRWGNNIASLRWNHVFSNKLFSNVTASYNYYHMNLESYDDLVEGSRLEKSRTAYNSKIRDWTAQVDFEYDPVPQHRIQFGGSFTYHRFQPETWSVMVNEQDNNVAGVDTTYNSPNPPTPAQEYTAYVEDDWHVGRLHLRPGVVFSLFHVQGKNYPTLQPRLAARYAFTDAWAVKAAYTDMAQYIHLLTSMPIAMPTDLWVPITRNIKPERARQVSLGGYFTGWKGWELSAEVYYKDLRNVLEYRDGLSFLGFSGSWEQLVSMGRGRSRGLELMARRTEGRTTGWVAYTLARSDRKFDKDSGVNAGEWFPHAYDRRHTLNLVVNHKFSHKLDLDATWMFHSGEAATVATQRETILYPSGAEEIAYYVPSRNNYRLPPSHTLSLGLNMRRKLKCGALRTWNISIYNAYNSMNPTLVYRQYYGEVYTGEEKLVKYTLLPIIPSFTLTYKW